MRESDIRPAEILDEYLRLSALDAEALFPDRSALTGRLCPGCGADKGQPAFSKHGFDLVRCSDCDTLYVTPCPTADQLAHLYTDSPSTRYWAEVFFPSVAEARRSRIFAPRAKRVAALMAARGRPLTKLVEVGAGAGIFLEEMHRVAPEAGLRAVEPGRSLARQCRKAGVEVFEGTAEVAAHDPDWAGSADLVACFEVVEHTPDSLSFVAALGALARPGGTVLFSGLSGDGFDIRTLGVNSKAVSPPHHLTFLSRRGATRLLERAGLEEIEIFTPGELDVDIVVNALKEDDTLVAEPFLRSLLLGPDEDARSAFQSFLRDNGLSSHMWVMGCRPAGGDATTP